MESKNLQKVISEYCKKDIYPFHMPGHKRQIWAAGEICSEDFTEVEGLDDLHDPEEVLLYERERIAKLYGAKDAYILVNGSTAGNLASIYASLKDKEKILIQRNSHKSVYHGAILRHAEISYLYPQQRKDGIYKAITEVEVKAAIENNAGIKAVVITSPTYEGYVAPIEKIAKICHENNIELIVDAAHGAHLGFSNDFPKSPIQQGADLVIVSVHKTLPALTQAALVLVNDTEKSEALQEALNIFETSSPSYILMKSISVAMNFLEEKESYFEVYSKLLKDFYKNTDGLKVLKVLTDDTEKKDIGKIIISTAGANLTGKELADILRNKYQIETEMSSFTYVIAMTSIVDTREGIKRLEKALLEIDEGLEEKGKQLLDIDNRPQKKMEIYEAKASERDWVDIEKADNLVAGEFVCLYPPGAPIINPGEQYDKKTIDLLKEAKKEKLHITGLNKGRVCVVKSN